jgi:flagellar hook-basal body complex protein FliE
MNNLQINQLLSEMRALAAQAGGGAQQPEAVKGPGFADVLKDAVSNVNQAQADAAQKQNAFLSGENVPLTDVMVALQKSRVSFEAVKQVRNHLLNAYQEVSRMQV